MRSFLFKWIYFVLFAVAQLVMPVSHASTITWLNDGDTFFGIDPTSSAGMSIWTVDGSSNIMPQQWFWFRTGSSFSNQGPLQSVDSLGTPSDLSCPASACITYHGTTLEANLVLNLIDGQPAVMLEQIEWSNLSQSNVDLTVFQFVYFHFSNSDSLNITDNTAQQNAANGSADIEVDPFDSLYYKGYEAGSASVLLADLTNASTSASFNLNQSFSSASGDVAALFEWQATLTPKGNGSSLILYSDEDATVTPEPAAVLLTGCPVLLMLALRLRKR